MKGVEGRGTEMARVSKNIPFQRFNKGFYGTAAVCCRGAVIQLIACCQLN